MESAPGHIDVGAVREAMIEMPGRHRCARSDLHVWTITSGLEALSAHVAVEEVRSRRALLAQMHAMLRERYGIDHLPIQLEPGDFEERQLPV